MPKGLYIVQHHRYTLKHHNNDLGDGYVNWALLDVCQIG